MSKRYAIEIWAIRSIVIFTMALVIFAFLRPWWTADFGSGSEVKVYAWGLRHTLSSLSGYLAKDVTPQWQVILAWIYLGLSGMVALLATWIKRVWGAALPALAGVGFIAYPIVTIYSVISNRIAAEGIALEGESVVGGMLPVTSELHPVYYLMYVGGALLLIVSLAFSIMTHRYNKSP